MPGIHFNPYAPSFFRFGTQDRQEIPPARVADTCIKPGFCRRPIGQKLARLVGVGFGFSPPQHVFDFEVFDREKVVAGHQFAGLLVVEVFALVSDLAVPGGHSFAFDGTVGAAAFSR